MSANIPEKMRAVVLEEYRENQSDAIRGLAVRERPVAKPRRGQVLVRVEAAPCNPSDLLLLQGMYGTKKSLPTVPGWEGAGTVVASGGGIHANYLVGMRVACAVQDDRDGTWAEYTVANARDCIPLKAALPTEQAASFIINPMTACALLETARRAGHKAVVHTAGASQLGRMIHAIAAEMEIPVIHLVRREEQVEMLKSRGAAYVINTSHDGFIDELKLLAKALKATAAFEAIAGDMTGIIVNTLPPGATVYLYGALSETPCGSIDPIELVFHNKTLTGFFLGNWLKSAGLINVIRTASRVQQMLIDGRIATAIQRRLTLDEAVEGLLQYTAHMTEGKVLILPHGQ
jgi:NADPH:quinone reductase-like Zn-dependent oxidoreductase